MVDEFQARIEELRARKEKNLQMGGPKKVARQHASGKLHVREHLERPWRKDGNIPRMSAAAEQLELGGAARG